jgi:hypothetical protein
LNVDSFLSSDHRLFSQAHSGAITIGIDEFDPCGFERQADNNQRCPPRRRFAGFELVDRHNSDPCRMGELLLTPAKEAAGGSALCG